FGSFFEKASLDYARAQLVLQKADTAPVPAQLPAYQKSRQTICLQLIKRWRNVLYDRSYKNLRLPPSVLMTYYVGSHTGLTRSLTDELIHHVESIHAKLKVAHDIARCVHEVNPTCEEDILTDRWPGNL